MTALKKYQRLETSGLWRAQLDAQRREVTVSFGDATLVMSDAAGRVLSHWSLPAVTRLNPDALPALYGPEPDAAETLEIEDDLMIGAIEKIRHTLSHARPHPGRLRLASILGAIVVFSSIGLFWLPSALTRQAQRAMPASKQLEIGASLLGHVQRQAGQTCREPLGSQALALLKERLLAAGSSAQIVVVPDGPEWPIVLPGNIVVLPRSAVEQASEPAVTAGYIIEALVGGNAGGLVGTAPNNGAQQVDAPFERLLQSAGLRQVITLLTTGDLPVELLQRHAQTLLAERPQRASTADLQRGFAQAGVAFGPWARFVDPEGQLYAPDEVQSNAQQVVLNDGDWIRLQGICSR
ncbi:MAG: hypothetical protein JKX69_02285 [Rhodobacteraceae bacterium]|nr:hypothetical protein [Paracoccaceae bacterium]